MKRVRDVEDLETLAGHSIIHNWKVRKIDAVHEGSVYFDHWVDGEQLSMYISVFRETMEDCMVLDGPINEVVELLFHNEGKIDTRDTFVALISTIIDLNLEMEDMQKNIDNMKQRIEDLEDKTKESS